VNKLYLLIEQKPMECRSFENDANHRDEIEYKTHASSSLHFIVVRSGKSNACLLIFHVQI